jgi:hypothetical protein
VTPAAPPAQGAMTAECFCDSHPQCDSGGTAWLPCSKNYAVNTNTSRIGIVRLQKRQESRQTIGRLHDLFNRDSRSRKAVRRQPLHLKEPSRSCNEL